MSKLIANLKAGGHALGMCVMYPAPVIIERVGAQFDFMWICGQHGELDYHDIISHVRACELTGCASLVRVPWLEAGIIGKVLDTAATGVIVPCVDSVEEAKAAVAAAKFPPLGRRSYGGRRIVDRRGRGYSDDANDTQMLIVQIESPAAMEAAEEIAAIDGVDALMIGPDDILLRRGESMTAPRTAKNLGPDIKAMGEAARKHGKLAMGVGATPETFKLCMEHGYQLIVTGSDSGYLVSAATASVSEARKMLEANSQADSSNNGHTGSGQAGERSIY